MADQSTSMTKRRGTTAGKPRSYSVWEWTRGYLALVLTAPLYLFLWAFAALCPQLPTWATRALLRSHERTTQRRKRDVRIPGVETIPAYMLRWWKIPRNWAFNIYYHIVKRSDDDTALHDHPWWNFSIVLDGGYWEHLILPGGVHRKTWYGPGAVRFRPHGGFAHRLELKRSDPLDDFEEGKILPTLNPVELPVKSIFITGPVLRRWGFHHTDQWVDAYEWDAYCDEKGISTMKMAGYAEQVNRKGPNE